MLGGDSFGYHWLDEDHFAFYLLDVCNHGIGPALMSISILNMIRFQNLKDVDFRKPEEVLSTLNKTFQMGDHNDMFFSVLYGVYNKTTKELTYAGAGHPAPIIISERTCTKLKSRNIIIGVVPEFNFKSEKISIELPSSLYIFSDGVYEFRKPMNDTWSLEKLYDYFSKPATGLFGHESIEIDNLYDHLKRLNKNQKLKDDFSVLKITFM
jgi:sigma-B regulation protein RsbU (phosphoserine phosphatase)